MKRNIKSLFDNGPHSVFKLTIIVSYSYHLNCLISTTFLLHFKIINIIMVFCDVVFLKNKFKYVNITGFLY